MKDFDQHQVSVTVFHKTLLDYLMENEEAQLLLKSELGESFDAHTAIMAGLIMSVPVYSEITCTEDSVAWAFFHFNTLAESSTGQHREELVDIFDEVERERTSAFINGLGHWSSAFFLPGRLQSSNLGSLANT